MVNKLKYLSINVLMGFPNYHINPATRKKRAERLIIDAIRKSGKLISNAPAEIVNILYGMGVNPAVKIITTPYSEYCCSIDIIKCSVNPGMLLKKK